MQTMQARNHRKFKAMIQGSAVFINNWTGPTVSSHGLVSMTVFNIFDQTCQDCSRTLVFLRSTIYEYEMYDPLFDEALVVSGRRQGQGPVAGNDLVVEVRVKLGLRCFGGRGSGGLGGLDKG